MLATLLASGGAPGCGSESSGSPGGATQTARFGTDGGELRDDAHGVVVTFPRGSLSRTTTVAMRVTNTHSSAVSKVVDEGRALSDVAVWLTLTPSAFAPAGAATIRMDLAGAYHPVHSTKAIANADGLILAIPSERSADGAGIVGTLHAETLPIVAAGQLDRESTLEVFTTNRVSELAPPPASGCVTRFDAPSDTTVCTAPLVCGQANTCWSGAVGDLSQRRVALLVHGFDANLRDLSNLAGHLRSFTRGQDSASYYDTVLGFQYATDTAIADIGAVMARQVAPLLGDTSTTVDVFAHSMGVVVARYAMETASLQADRLGPNIAHFVALGGPNSGLPFAKGDLLQTLLLRLHTKTAPALLDLMTDGKDGTPLPGHPFLPNLNLGPGARGLDFATARYFSVSGDDYAGETFHGLRIGDAIHALYLLTAGPSVKDDGLVATYSAQSDVLARQSMSWTPGSTLRVSHFDLHEGAAFPAIDGLLERF